MALKTLILRKKVDDKKKELEALRAKTEEFNTRESELMADIEKAETDEERAAVEAAVETFDAEKTEHEGKMEELTREIEGLEKELTDEEGKQATPVSTEPKEGRKEERNMEIRDKFFGLSMQDRDALFARQEVKDYIESVRSVMKRDVGGVTNANILIPQVMLPYLRQVIEESSKLLKHVNLQNIPGEGRMIIDGGFPEAVWTEMCGKLNELEIGYNDIEIGGYKVGGFISVCNALLEDSDVALASDIITKLGQGIGYALDKAIIYGTGTKMPLGIIPRLLQTSEPADYPSTARTWQDLHTSNVKTITAANSTGLKLFQGIATAAGATKNKFSRGGRFWVMNETTKAKLTVEAMSINAAGAIVTGMTDTMPVLGGAIETLDFIPDGVILVGYEGLYLLAERAGLRTAASEHYLFTEDKTVFKGTARYDGKPVIPEGFAVIGIDNTTVLGNAVSFEADSANSVQSIALNTATATVAAGSTIKLLATTAPGKGTVTWTSATEAKATVDSNGVVTGVAAGSSVITASCNGLTASCTVTVTA